MNSIRARLTLSYALALGGTLLVFAMVVWTGSQSGTFRASQVRVEQIGDLASRIIAQDSLKDGRFSLDARRYLGALPGYVIVADSSRVLFASAAVDRMTAKDRQSLTGVVFQLPPDQPAATVRLDSVNLFLLARFRAATAVTPALRVVAGEPTVPVSFLRSELFAPIIVALPVILVLSVIVAYAAAGRALEPVDRLIGDLAAIQDGRSLHRRLPVESEDNELDRLSETINAMIARLESSFAALRRFTADASHELKTPLTVLRADIERAMQSKHVRYDQLPPLEEALAETTRMADLVDSLLTLARADEGRFDIHRETVALGPMMNEVYETAVILGEATGVKAELAIAEPITVQGDPVRLRQLFLNLATNALKYTPKGGTVTLALERRGDHVAFSVHDTGVGIAAADLPFIFDRFWRADRARSRGAERGGFGLGLAISQWIAHAHGGSISVASRLGRGSTFTVSLPLPHEPDGEPVSQIPH